MKKIMMMLALVLTISTAFARKGEDVINNQALNSFKTEFAGATDISWSVGKGYYKVAFTLNDQKIFAFYNTDGEFLAVTRFISSEQLPLRLQAGLKKSLDGYWVTDLFEISNGDDTGYYVTLENADAKVVLRSVDGRNWSLYQKAEKI